MKIRLIVAFLMIGLAATALAQDRGAKKPGFKTLREKASYALGLNLGMNFKSQSVEIEPALLYQGLKDGLAGVKPLLSDDDVAAAIQEFEQEILSQQAAALKALGDKNLRQGQAFLIANKKKPGVKVLPSGLQYKILKPGTGKRPTADSMIEANYSGTLLDGTEFDNSDRRGGASKFLVSAVIQGWSEALQMMEVGAKWQLFIPPNLAYGEDGFGQAIGPNATLIFEVELVGIESPAKKQSFKPRTSAAR